MDGAVTCSRLGCNETAVAVFAFDARESLVWLDPMDTPGRGAGVLCLTHADRLSPPRGWALLDRRGARVAALARRARGDDAREPQAAS